jgi:methylmalonyl-CoA/ethylmalonyl-CoA epimerase
MRIDHVALAVEDIDAAIKHYKDVWNLDVSHREILDEEGVEEVLLPLGDSHLQLVRPTGPDSTVARFLARRGEGLHHIAYEVDDLVPTLARLKVEGVTLIDKAPRRGGRGRMVAFVHPKANHGLLVELIQRPRNP